MGCHALLQEIFQTQGSNSGLLHCRQILYQLNHKGSPGILEWEAFPFSRRSSPPRNRPGVSYTAGGSFTNRAIGKRCVPAIWTDRKTKQHLRKPFLTELTSHGLESHASCAPPREVTKITCRVRTGLQQGNTAVYKPHSLRTRHLAHIASASALWAYWEPCLQAADRPHRPTSHPSHEPQGAEALAPSLKSKVLKVECVVLSPRSVLKCQLLSHV